MSHLSITKMLRNEAAIKISKIPLSTDTVYRCISEMSSDIEKKGVVIYSSVLILHGKSMSQLTLPTNDNS